MHAIFPPLLSLIVNASDSQLAEYVEYLKTENRILRSLLGKRINPTEAETGLPNNGNAGESHQTICGISCQFLDLGRE